VYGKLTHTEWRIAWKREEERKTKKEGTIKSKDKRY
jgi:hypothetical protein